MKRFAKTVVVGVVLYLTERGSFDLASRWFQSEVPGREWWKSKAETMQRRFWKSALAVWSVIGVVIAFRLWMGRVNSMPWFRVLGVALALTATLGRGGWGIQTIDGDSLPERIDRGMFVTSQLGATGILLFLLLGP